ncbi:MAG TPA: hypothetical protein H9956_03690 [Candidatus Eisenbergiella pullicola]|nr:hypothetical protein [Candidatus Eisenbergiella pullicola]
MLKKLLRHEWLETWKIPALISSIILALSAVSALYFHFAASPAPDVELNVGNTVLFLGYVMLICSVSLILAVYLGVRFYKNLYTDEGYLMHTLPVNPWMLLASKALVASAWLWIVNLLMLLLILPVTMAALPKLAYFDPGDLSMVSESLLATLGGSIPGALFYLFPYLIVNCAFTAITLYTAVCLGQLFPRHKVLAAILCYLGINALISTASSFFILPGMTGVIITHADEAEQFFSLVMPAFMRTIYIISFFVEIFLSAILFFVSDYIMRKCLNLD